MRVLTLIFREMEKHALEGASDVLQTCWASFVDGVPVYQHAIVQAEVNTAGFHQQHGNIASLQVCAPPERCLCTISASFRAD